MAILLPALSTFAQAPGDAELDEAIARGADYLRSRIRDDGTAESITYRLADGGAEALVALALLRAEEHLHQPPPPRLLAELRNRQPQRCLARALRLEVDLRRAEADAAAEDAQWLRRQAGEVGLWGLDAPADASNTLDTAAATRAMMAAERAGIDAARLPWAETAEALARRANRDGGFGYQAKQMFIRPLRGSSHGNTTAAAAAAMAALRNRVGQKPRGELLAPYRRAMDWLLRNYAIQEVPHWYWGDAPLQEYRYWLLEAACQGPRPARLGEHDVESDLIEALLAEQLADGGWPASGTAEDRTVASAWALLCLCRARQPLAAQWLNASSPVAVPQDLLDEICRRTRAEHRREVGWRWLPASANPGQLARSPLLLVPLSEEGLLPEKQLSALQASRRGGTGVVLIDPRERSVAPRREVLDILAPGERSRLVDKPRRLGEVGVRRIGSASPGIYWFAHSALFPKPREASPHQGALASFLVRNELRLLPTWKFSPPASAARPERRIPLAIASLDGSDIPLADLEYRIGRDLERAISVSVEVVECDPAGDIPVDVRLLWLIGKQFAPPGEEVEKNLRAFLRRGGMLLVEPLDGNPAFAREAKDWCEQRLEASFEMLSPEHPLLSGGFGGGLGCELRSVSLNARAAERYGKARIEPPLVASGGQARVVVVISPLAVAGSIARPQERRQAAFASLDARRLALNLLLYAHLQAKQGLSPPAEKAVVGREANQPSR